MPSITTILNWRPAWKHVGIAWALAIASMAVQAGTHPLDRAMDTLPQFDQQVQALNR